MKPRSLALIAIIALIGAGLFAWQLFDRAGIRQSAPVASLAAIGTISATPVTAETCYFVWASHTLPGLTEQLQESIHALQPAARARAEAYGEDCVYVDGHADFGVMETDFYIEVYVIDISDMQELGNWMGQVMPIIDQLPPDQVPGGVSGFVEFKFLKNGSESTLLRVPIDRYRKESRGKSGSDLYKLFSGNP